MKNSEKNVAVPSNSNAAHLYDLSMLEEMDDNEYLVELLEILLTEAPKDLKDMKEALEAGNTDIICKKAHKLKGGTGIIQAEGLKVMLEDIEAIGKTGMINNDLSCLIENAAYHYHLIEKALKIHLETLSQPGIG